MKQVSNLCRIILGLLFIFSGFVKAIDSMGSAYKFSDYFIAFGFGQLSSIALIGAFALALAEFTIGAALILRLKTKLAAWAALFFMIIFTPLTLYIAIKNPVSDCGCFGDALVISNWATFWKNIIILIITLIVFKKRKELSSDKYLLIKVLFIIILSGITIGVEIYGIRHLPIIDFRPYAVGKNISEEMTVPEGEEGDVYNISLKYLNKTTGKIETFSETNIPIQDTTYEYVSTDQKLIRQGYRPPINLFAVFHPEIGDITDELLYSDDYIYLIIAQNIDKIETENINKIKQLADYASQKGYKVYGVTASDINAVTDFTTQYSIPFTFCTADETQIKTMIRNFGVIVLHNGTIISKWSHRDLPDIETYSKTSPLAYSMSILLKKNNQYKIFLLLFVIFAIGITYKIKRK